MYEESLGKGYQFCINEGYSLQSPGRRGPMGENKGKS